MVWPRERRRSLSDQILAAVAAYLRLLEAEWDSLTDVQRRDAVRLAAEAASGLPEPAAELSRNPRHHRPPEQAEGRNA